MLWFREGIKPTLVSVVCLGKSNVISCHWGFCVEAMSVKFESHSNRKQQQHQYHNYLQTHHWGKLDKGVLEMNTKAACLALMIRNSEEKPSRLRVCFGIAYFAFC